MNDDLDEDSGEDLSAEKKKTAAAYAQIIEAIFRRHHKKGATEFTFERDELESVATDLHKKKLIKIKKPKNLGDVIYSFRHRRPLPDSILATQPAGKGWLILGAGDGLYRFRLNRVTHIRPNRSLGSRKIPNATPEMMLKYALDDEQALLAKIRSNRLVDVFLGLTAYPLQSHVRAKIPNYGQIEIDDLYVGIDRRGVHYVIPMQAKGPKDTLGAIQTIQDVTFCQTARKPSGKKIRRSFHELTCLPVSAQIYKEDGHEIIAMFLLSFDGDEVTIQDERHYELVHRDEVSPADLAAYGKSKR